MTHKN